jgi:predicted PurR-regulated permease PerM
MEEQHNQSSNNQWWNRLSVDPLVRFLLLFACGWASITIFKYFEYVFFSFTSAAILALLLNYPVRYLERFLGRGIALSIVITLSLITIIILLIVIGLTISSQIQELTTQIIHVFSSPSNPLEQLQNRLQEKNIRLNLEPLEAQIKLLLSSSTTFLFSSIPSLFSSYITFIIVLVVAFFMLIDGGKLWHLLLKLVPTQYRGRFAVAVQQNFHGFFRGQLIISLMLSIANFFIFLILHVPFAFALAIVLGALDLIPGIGATLGVTLVSLIVLVQSGWIMTLKVLVSCIILQQIQDNLIAPRIMGKAINLNPVVIFFALLVGAKVAGLLGVFLSVPVAGVVVSLLEIEEMQS